MPTRSENLLVGRKPVEEMLKRSSSRVRHVYALKGIQESFPVKVTVKSRQELDELSGGLNHKGVVAEIEPAGSLPLERLYPLRFILALDQVQDPQNLGSIFRLAAALGGCGVLITKDNSASVTNSVRAVSVGATEFVPYSVATNLVSAIKKLKKEGFWTYSAVKDEESVSIYSEAFTQKSVLVLGNEESGIRDLVVKTSDLKLHIPQTDDIESLNVSQAASIMGYEIYRQNHGN